MPMLPKPAQAQVRLLWNRTLRSHPSTYNGWVFTADSLTPICAMGHWTEFKRVLAQIRFPELSDAINIRPVSVRGVLICREISSQNECTTESVILGRRATDALFRPGAWELLPAGLVEASTPSLQSKPDWRSQLLSELTEETGVPACAIAHTTPICVVEYPRSSILELGVALSCRWQANDVIELHRNLGNEEYTELVAVPLLNIDSFVGGLSPDLRMPTLHFLRHARSQRD